MKKVNVKEKLENQLNRIISDLKLNSNNSELFDRQMEELLSTKSQLDVEPTEIHIKSEDVVDRFEFGSYGITRTKNEIIFETNGFRTIVKPWIAKLYGILNFICDVKAMGEKADAEDKRMYDVLLVPCIFFLETPLFCFNEDKLTAELYNEMLTSYMEYAKRNLNKDLQPETEEENNEFKKSVEMFEDFKKEVKE